MYARQRKLFTSTLIAVDKNERSIVNLDSSKKSFELENLKEKYPLELAIVDSVTKLSTLIVRVIAVPAPHVAGVLQVASVNNAGVFYSG